LHWLAINNEPEAGNELDREAMTEADRKELSEAIVTFTQKATRGMWCTYLKEHTKEVLKVLIVMDKGAKHLVILSGEKLETKEVVCPLEYLDGVYRATGDSEKGFPRELLDLVKPSELERLFMVTFQPPYQPSKTRFCLLEQSPKQTDIFIESLRALHLYLVPRDREDSDSKQPPHFPPDVWV
jgi:hypothetical protein